MGILHPSCTLLLATHLQLQVPRETMTADYDLTVVEIHVSGTNVPAAQPSVTAPPA
jgi:hypothetical protein